MESQRHVMVAKQFTFHIDINTRKKITFHFGFILNETNTDCFNLAIFFFESKDWETQTLFLSIIRS